MAKENPTWGYTRIRGDLKSLGHEVARNTIGAILKDHGIAPAPERGTNTPWTTFLAAHWDGLAAGRTWPRPIRIPPWRRAGIAAVFFGALASLTIAQVQRLKLR